MKARHAAADLAYHADGIRARDEGCLGAHLVPARDHQGIHKAHGCGVDLDENLSWTGYRVTELSDFQCFRPVEGLTNHCLHDVLPVQRAC